MKLKFHYFFLLVLEVLTFHQDDYFLEFKRLEIIRINKHYMIDVKMVTYKYNRTYPAVNATIAVATNLGSDVQGIAQAYSFVSNEYRLFPIHFGFNLCDSINNNDFGLAAFYKLGNFTGCPIKKGTYCFYNWAPDSSRFPPHIPNGEYMIEVQFTFPNSTEVALIRFYGIVNRPLGRRH